MLCWNIYVVALEETDRYTSKRIKAENECVNKIYCVYLHALFLFLYTYRKKGVWMRVKLVLWQGIILGWTCANDTMLKSNYKLTLMKDLSQQALFTSGMRTVYKNANFCSSETDFAAFGRQALALNVVTLTCFCTTFWQRKKQMF